MADNGFDWTLGASGWSSAEPEDEKKKPLSQQKSLDFVLLRHEKITTPRQSSNFEEMDIMANLLAGVGRKRDLVGQNMVECMRNVEDRQAQYRSEVEKLERDNLERDKLERNRSERDRSQAAL